MLTAQSLDTTQNAMALQDLSRKVDDMASLSTEEYAKRHKAKKKRGFFGQVLTTAPDIPQAPNVLIANY